MLHSYTKILLSLLTAALLYSPSIFAKPRPVTTLPESNPIAMALADGGYVGGNSSSHQRGGYNNAIEDMSSKKTKTININHTANTFPSPASFTDADIGSGSVYPLSQGGYSAQNIAEALQAARKQPR